MQHPALSFFLGAATTRTEPLQDMQIKSSKVQTNKYLTRVLVFDACCWFIDGGIQKRFYSECIAVRGHRLGRLLQVTANKPHPLCRFILLFGLSKRLWECFQNSMFFVSSRISRDPTIDGPLSICFVFVGNFKRLLSLLPIKDYFGFTFSGYPLSANRYTSRYQSLIQSILQRYLAPFWSLSPNVVHNLYLKF